MGKILNLLRGRRARMERDLDRELRYHVDRRVQDMVQAGQSEAEARRQVGIEFGGYDQVEEDVRDTWMLATLSGGFAAIALLLSVVGLYGVMSFVVTSRTQEIGIRMALGATRSTAVWLVAADAVAMIGAGTALALPCLWGVGRLVEAQLFGVRAIDGPTIAIASTLLALVALAAAMIPAWRAASVSPTEALRFE